MKMKGQSYCLSRNERDVKAQKKKEQSKEVEGNDANHFSPN
jgi:hypothetical protein